MTDKRIRISHTILYAMCIIQNVAKAFVKKIVLISTQQTFRQQKMRITVVIFVNYLM